MPQGSTRHRELFLHKGHPAILDRLVLPLYFRCIYTKESRLGHAQAGSVWLAALFLACLTPKHPMLPETSAHYTCPHPLVPEHPIMFFDAKCALCQRMVAFARRNDRSGNIRFVALQSRQARTWLLPLGEDPSVMKSVLWLDTKGTLYRQSEAVIRIAWQMGGLCRVPAALGFLVPRPLRNAAYDVLARNRYRWFGCYDASGTGGKGVSSSRNLSVC